MIDTYSEEWRHQCEVRTCIRMSLANGKDALRAFLDGCERKRGLPLTQRLREAINAQWRAGNRGKEGEWYVETE